LLEVLAEGDYKEVVEVPYFFKERERGSSKAGFKEYFTYLAYVMGLSLKTGEIYRVIKYTCVGLTGALVTLAVYSFFRAHSFGRLIAYAFALECAILTNFILNEAWTFRDKVFFNRSLKMRIVRFLEFNLICLYGALFSFLVFSFLLGLLKINTVISALAGVGVGFLWNFIASTNAVWLSRFSLKKHKMDVEKGYYHRVLDGNRIQGYWHKKKFSLIAGNIKDTPVLDLGCGPGVFLHYYGGFPGLKVNLDYSLEQLKYGKALNPQALYVNASVSELPFAQGTFSTVFLIETIEHVDEDSGKKVMNEISRVLKKGGRLVLTTPNYKSLWIFFEWIVSIVGSVDYRAQHVNHFNLNKISQYVSSAGLSVRKRETFFIFSPFFAIFSLRLSELIFRAERRLFPAFGNIILIEAVKELSF
jgi:putative flippase GtrA/SAM-dependent methyltransferase